MDFEGIKATSHLLQVEAAHLSERNDPNCLTIADELPAGRIVPHRRHIRLLSDSGYRSREFCSQFHTSFISHIWLSLASSGSKFQFDPARRSANGGGLNVLINNKFGNKSRKQAAECSATEGPENLLSFA